MLEGDRYCYENILIHEFGHAVMDLGLQEPVRVRLSLQATCRTLHQRLEADLSTMMMLLLPRPALVVLVAHCAGSHSGCV
jgi:hypothetical protein